MISLVEANANHSFTLVSKEKQLIKFLLDRYAEFGRIGRPVINTSEIITVNFGLSLIQILRVDEKNQVLETNVWETFVRSRIILVFFFIIVYLKIQRLTQNCSQYENCKIVWFSLMWFNNFQTLNF